MKNYICETLLYKVYNKKKLDHIYKTSESGTGSWLEPKESTHSNQILSGGWLKLHLNEIIWMIKMSEKIFWEGYLQAHTVFKRFGRLW